MGADYGIANTWRLLSEEIPRLVELCQEKGFAGFDTAQDYSVREEVFGHARTRELFSKISCHVGFDSTERIRRSIISNLSAMGRDHLDGLAAHSVEQFLRDPQDATSTMKWLKDAGLIKSWGVSLYTLEEMNAVLEISTPDYIQAPVSALDARFTKPATREMLHQRGIALHGRSVYLQGALLLSPEILPSSLSGLSPAVRHIHELARLESMSVSRLLLDLVVRIEGVSRLVIGVNSVSHLEATFDSLSAFSGDTSGISPQFVFHEDNHLLDPRRWSG